MSLGDLYTLFYKNDSAHCRIIQSFFFMVGFKWYFVRFKDLGCLFSGSLPCGLNEFIFQSTEVPNALNTTHFLDLRMEYMELIELQWFNIVKPLWHRFDMKTSIALNKEVLTIRIFFFHLKFASSGNHITIAAQYF